jgi:hypothetical protein
VARAIVPCSPQELAKPANAGKDMAAALELHEQLCAAARRIHAAHRDITVKVRH